MSSLFLDLRNRMRTLDFINEHVAYLPETYRKKIEARLEELDMGKHVSQEELAELARDVGRKSWPARTALREYLRTQDGCDEEWRLVAAAVSDSTAHLMERFRHGTKCQSLDQMLDHEESASAFRDTERTEIAEVRRASDSAIWRERHDALAAQTKKVEKRLGAAMLRIEAMRELAVNTPWIQDELFSKIERLEDDCYFAGNELDVERLDEELKLYREEKAIPATDL